MKEIFEGLIAQMMEKGFFLEEAVEMVERSMITRALASTDGNQCAASKLLGIHRNTLQRKIRAYKLNGAAADRKPPGRLTSKRAQGARVS